MELMSYINAMREFPEAAGGRGSEARHERGDHRGEG